MCFILLLSSRNMLLFRFLSRWRDIFCFWLLSLSGYWLLLIIFNGWNLLSFSFFKRRFKIWLLFFRWDHLLNFHFAWGSIGFLLGARLLVILIQICEYGGIDRMGSISPKKDGCDIACSKTQRAFDILFHGILNIELQNLSH